MATRVVIQQSPTLLPQAQAWSTGLFHCFQDMKICCLYFWCFWCMTCNTAQKFGECVCLPLLDLFSSCFLAYFYIPPCALPISLSMRASVRHRYGIPGSISEDCPIATCCAPCSWCQIAREFELRGQTCTIISHQPTPLQAPPPIRTATHVPPHPHSQPTSAYPPPAYSEYSAYPPVLPR